MNRRPIAPPRRGLLAAVTALAVAPGITFGAIPASPDAVLLAACAEHMRCVAKERRLLEVMRAFDAADERPPAAAAERAWDAAYDRSCAALDAVIGMRAATFEGAAAKARSVMAYRSLIAGPNDTEEGLAFEDLGALSVLRDLERMTGGAA